MTGWLKEKARVCYMINSELAFYITKVKYDLLIKDYKFYSVVFIPMSSKDLRVKNMLSSERTLIMDDFDQIQFKTVILAKDMGWDIKKIELLDSTKLNWVNEK
jgi:hypothetical protein